MPIVGDQVVLQCLPRRHFSSVDPFPLPLLLRRHPLHRVARLRRHQVELRRLLPRSQLLRFPARASIHTSIRRKPSVASARLVMFGCRMTTIATIRSMIGWHFLFASTQRQLLHPLDPFRRRQPSRPRERRPRVNLSCTSHHLILLVLYIAVRLRI